MKKHTLFILACLNVVFLGCQDSATADVGTAGSLARFTINGDYLYAIDRSHIEAIDISTPSEPKSVHSISVSWNIETLFSYQNYIYVGARDGMYIYEQQANGTLDLTNLNLHSVSCDPVVVSNDLAFVTLRSRAGCNRQLDQTNSLNIYDVSNPEQSNKIYTKELYAPAGLAVDNNLLFICDTDAGLKIFDINQTANSVDISLKETVKSLHCNDVIASQNTLYIRTENNVTLYDYSSNPLTLLGVITD